MGLCCCVQEGSADGQLALPNKPSPRSLGPEQDVPHAGAPKGPESAEPCRSLDDFKIHERRGGSYYGIVYRSPH
jgi:hypothetical protein